MRTLTSEVALVMMGSGFVYSRDSNAIIYKTIYFANCRALREVAQHDEVVKTSSSICEIRPIMTGPTSTGPASEIGGRIPDARNPAPPVKACRSVAAMHPIAMLACRECSLKAGALLV